MSTVIPPTVQEYLQEDDLTDERRDILSTLPRERGWISEYFYQYEGFWIHPRFLKGLVSCQKHFKAHDTDIILVTNPKSGTTWLKALAFALLNRSRLPDVRNEHPLLTSSPHDLVPFLEIILYTGAKDVPDLSKFTPPRLFATHVHVGSLPNSVKTSSCKIVYLCRDPKDTFVSLWHFCNKMRPKERGTNKLEDVFDSFCNGVSGYGPFWDHVMGYWNESLKNPHKVLFLKYEEMQEHSTTQLRRLADFLECPFSPEEETKGTVDEILRLCSFDHLSNLEVNKTGIGLGGEPSQAYFRKGGVGGWGKTLTPEMAERLDRIVEAKMHGFKF